METMALISAYMGIVIGLLSIVALIVFIYAAINVVEALFQIARRL